jgi:hypothetical protein
VAGDTADYINDRLDGTGPADRVGKDDIILSLRLCTPIGMRAASGLPIVGA